MPPPRSHAARSRRTKRVLLDAGRGAGGGGMERNCARRGAHDHYDGIHTISAPEDNLGAEGQAGVSTDSLYPPACLLSPHHGAASAALGKAKDGRLEMRTFVCVHYESEGYEREMWVNVSRILFFIRRGDRTQLKLDADVDLRVKETPDEIREQLQED